MTARTDLPTCFEVGPKGPLLHLRVLPGAAKNSLEDLRDDGTGRIRWCARVTAVPEKGTANKAVIDLLAKALKLPKSAFEVVDGQTARNKTLVVDCQADLLAEKVRTAMS